MAFVSGVGAGHARVRAAARVSPRVAPAARRSVRMMATDDSKSAAEANDLQAAMVCLEEGCEINDVQDILGRLESKKIALESEVDKISRVMGDLAKANLSKDRGFVAATMEAAVQLFQRAEDTYPKVGSPTPWTMDKAKKKRWN